MVLTGRRNISRRQNHKHAPILTSNQHQHEITEATEHQSCSMSVVCRDEHQHLFLCLGFCFYRICLLDLQQSVILDSFVIVLSNLITQSLNPDIKSEGKCNITTLETWLMLSCGEFEVFCSWFSHLFSQQERDVPVKLDV